jgi:hypothetical protein
LRLYSGRQDAVAIVPAPIVETLSCRWQEGRSPHLTVVPGLGYGGVALCGLAAIPDGLLFHGCYSAYDGTARDMGIDLEIVLIGLFDLPSDERVYIMNDLNSREP